jgi:hypothetical protein
MTLIFSNKKRLRDKGFLIPEQYSLLGGRLREPIRGFRGIKSRSPEPSILTGEFQYNQTVGHLVVFSLLLNERDLRMGWCEGGLKGKSHRNT